jgi:MFS transporter, UMF1 family
LEAGADAASMSDASGQPTKRASWPALVSWVLFDWAAQPYYTLVLTFLFAPYFATAVVGDGAAGQVLWGYAAAIAGLLVAIGSPILGAEADRLGRRKPWVALFGAILCASLATLWWATPNASDSTIFLTLMAFVIATCMAEFATVFTNAMMPTLVPRHEMGRLSGIGWAVGYAGGLLSLIVMAGLIVTDPATGKTMIGLDPLFSFATEGRQGDRLVGPIAGLWFIVFMIPFFIFVPDRTPKVSAQQKTPGGPFADIWQTLKQLPSFPDMLYFLLARMLYTDGLTAIFAFGGIYGASVFGWGAMELGLFGIFLTIAGIAGALIGGVLNDRTSSKSVITTALVLLIIAAAGILSVDKSHVLYLIDVPAKAANSAAFSSIGELVFLSFALLVGLSAAPVQSASRVLLAQLAPQEKMTQFFGLFAFSGKVTAFMAPLLVALATNISGSQRIGMSAILVLLCSGLILLTWVKTR